MPAQGNAAQGPTLAPAPAPPELGPQMVAPAPPTQPKTETPAEVKQPIAPAPKPEEPKPAPPQVPKEVEMPAEPPKATTPPVIAPAKPPELPVVPEKPAITPPKAAEPLPTAPVNPPAPAPVPPAKPDQAKPPEKPKNEKDDPFGTRNDIKGLRMWTDASGQYQIEARFVGFIDGSVRLQKANGNYVRIRYELLSSADQAFVIHQDGSLFAMEW